MLEMRLFDALPIGVIYVGLVLFIFLSKRIAAALRARIPTSIWIALLAISALTMITIGGSGWSCRVAQADSGGSPHPRLCGAHHLGG